MSFADGDIADLVAPVPDELVEYGTDEQEKRVLKATWRGYHRLKEQEEVLSRKIAGWKTKNAEGGRLQQKVVRRKPVKEELTKGGLKQTVVPKVFDAFKPHVERRAASPLGGRDGYHGGAGGAGGVVRGRIRPASAASRQRPGSRPGSVTSRLGRGGVPSNYGDDDHITYPSRPTSAGISRPTSAAQSRPPSARSRPQSATRMRRSPRSRPLSAKSYYTVTSTVEDSTVGPSTTNAPTTHRERPPADRQQYRSQAQEFWSDDGEDDTSAIIDKISLAPSPAHKHQPAPPQDPRHPEQVVRFGDQRAVVASRGAAAEGGARAGRDGFYRTPVERIGSLYSLAAWCRTRATHAALQDSHNARPPQAAWRAAPTTTDPYPDVLNAVDGESRGLRGVDPTTSHFLNLHDFVSSEVDAGFSIPSLLEEARRAAAAEAEAARRGNGGGDATAPPSDPPGVPARSQYHHRNGDVCWEACKIVDYRPDSHTYKIVWTFDPPVHAVCASPGADEGGGVVVTAENAINFKEQPKPKWVERLNLIIDGYEDDDVWAAKVDAARVLRDDAEMKVREHLFIDDVDDNVITPLSKAQSDRILKLVGRPYKPEEGYLLEKGLNELRTSFIHSSKEAVYRYKMLLPAERERVALLNIPDRSAAHASTRREDHEDLLSLRGTVDVACEPGATPLAKFHRARRYIADNLFFTHKILFHTLYKLMAKWGAFEDSKLFDTVHPNIPTPCEVETFRNHQHRTLRAVTDRLKREWNVHTVSIIQSDLVGHVSFYDDNLERFKQSRMARFLRVVNMIMGHQLQELILSAVVEYADYLRGYKAQHPWLEAAQRAGAKRSSVGDAAAATGDGGGGGVSFVDNFQAFGDDGERGGGDGGDVGGGGSNPSSPKGGARRLTAAALKRHSMTAEGIAINAFRGAGGVRGRADNTTANQQDPHPQQMPPAQRGSRAGAHGYGRGARASRVSFAAVGDGGDAGAPSPPQDARGSGSFRAAAGGPRKRSSAAAAAPAPPTRLSSSQAICHRRRSHPDFLTFVGAWYDPKAPVGAPVLRVCMLPRESEAELKRRETLEEQKMRVYMGYDANDASAPKKGTLDYVRQKHRASIRHSNAQVLMEDEDLETFKRRLSGASPAVSPAASPRGKFRAPWEKKKESVAAAGSGGKADDTRFAAPSSTMPTSGAVSLFRIRLTTNGHDQIVFEPSLADIEATVRGVLDGLFEETDDICGVGPQLFPLLGLDPVGLTASTKAMVHAAPPVLEAKAVVDEVLEKNIVGPNMLRDLYSDFQYLLDINTPAYLQEFLSITPPPKLEDYRHLCSRLQQDIEAIHLCSLNEVAFPLIKVECYEVKANLVKKAKEVMTAILAHLTDQCNQDIMIVDRKYNEYLDGIRVHPHTPEELRDLKLYVDAVPQKLNELSADFQAITNTVQLLAQFGYTPEQRSFETYWATYSRPRTITDELQDFDFRYRENRNRFMHKLRDNTEALVENLNQTKKQVDLLAYEDDELRMEEMYMVVQKIRVKLTECRDAAALYNSHEQIFRLPTTKHPLIREVTQQFEPYEQLWVIAQHFTEHYERWLNGSLLSLEADEVQQKAMHWLKDLGRLHRILANEAPHVIVRGIRDKLEQFKPHIPLITALLEKGMKARHWEQLGKLIGKEGKNKLVITDELTLNQLLEAGLAAKLYDVQLISETASKEWGLENQLERMKAEWKGKQFKLTPYRDTHLLTQVDDYQQMLDDHIVRTEMLLGSLDVRHIEDMVRKWEAQLNRMARIIEDWLRFQTMWHYLDPVFESDDLQNSMPAESTQFKKIDAMWKSVMQACANDPRVETRCSEESLVRTFDECNKHLEYILKQLHKFLDTKRVAFPRFYFLSNEDLIEVLADSKNPPVVQKHLKKCFEGINTLAFREDRDFEITHFVSALGERLEMNKPVRPADRGWLAEAWLGAVETEMKQTVLQHIRDAMKAYAAADCGAAPEARLPWLHSWPGQVVLTVSQIFWAKDVEAAILAGVTGLSLHTTRAKTHLNSLVDCVRGQLTRVARQTIQAMIVIEVHAMDIVERELIQNGVTELTQFAWVAQLRYYYEEIKPVDRRKYHGVVVKQTEAVVPYGNEYLGNTDRLVITPLTDRCYRTLLGALHLSYGGAPEGPAGTGKTETVKDLAKTLAKFCLVHNCSEQISHVEMAKMFRGLTASGSWACFDEFNRIEIQVLSVIAQQILSIQIAISQGRCEFDFEGTFNALETGCAVFITMNPGYAGRSELPDNLKARFRPVAMMVPDYALIAEISLFSCGFREGRALSGKIVAAYKLCSEQLSSQKHYDYGMRAVKSVLNAARAIRSTMPIVPNQSAEDIAAEETKVVLSALNDVNIPKFLPEDVQLFRMLTRDLFPEVEEDNEPKYDELLDGLLDACELLELQPSEALVHKAYQVNTTINVRHGLMLIGSTHSGKSTALHALAHAFGFAPSASRPGHFTPLQGAVISPEDTPGADPEAIRRDSLGGHSLPSSGGRRGSGRDIAHAPEVFMDGDDSLHTPSSGHLAVDDEKLQVHVATINPKAVTIGQLYGWNDAAMEWNDGVLSTVFKAASVDESMTKHWIVLDGPVDAEWIESMNTVLDDNKKLCLLNGDNVQLTDQMRMIFEVDNLAVASPATVSRCGMVYFDSGTVVTSDALIACWLAHLPIEVTSKANGADAVRALPSLLHRLVEPSLQFLFPSVLALNPDAETGIRYRGNMSVMPIALVSGFLRLLTASLVDLFENHVTHDIPLREVLQWVEGTFIVCLVWGLGGWLAPEDRQTFDAMVRQKLKEKPGAAGARDGAARRGSPKGTPASAADGTATPVTGGGDSDGQGSADPTAGEGEGGTPTDTDNMSTGSPRSHGAGAAAHGSPRAGPPAVARRRSERRPSGRWTCEYFHEIAVALPEFTDGRTLFDFHFAVTPGGGYTWPIWMETIPEFAIPDGARYHEVVVPTADHVRHGYWLDACVAGNIGVLFSGATGTGKSLLMQTAVERVRAEAMTSNYLQFSARITCNQAQALLEHRLERRKRGVYGPPLGRKCVMFVDDVAMPHVEPSGAQPAIELLRQWFDTHGWYETSKGNVGFKEIKGLTFVASVTPGGNTVTPRLLRHFVPIAVAEHDTPTLHYVFTTLLEHVRGANRWPPEFTAQKVEQVVAASIDVFGMVRGQLIATPERPFYTFNLRDISKVFHGMSMVPLEGVTSELEVMKLWMHETMRVYQDRIVDDADMDWFASTLSKTALTHIGRSAAEIRDKAPPERPLVFDEVGRGGKAPPVVAEVRDMNALRTDVEQAQGKYNAELSPSDAPLSLIVFDYVLEHVARLNRILRMPMGNALIIGLGGRGRQSVVQLATYMCEYKLARVRPQKAPNREAWRDDLRNSMKAAAGGVPEPTTFLITDACIPDESYLEDIACLLNTGEVPSLFGDDDIHAIVESIMKIAKELGRRDMTEDLALRQFVQKVRTEFHVVMSFSPVGTTLRHRLRSLPALVNCCYVDYFKAWPVEGLQSVGNKLLQKAVQGVDCTTAQYDRLLKNMVGMHNDAKAAVEEYKAETQEEIHITPTSYLELLNCFEMICKKKTREAKTLRDRYAKGVDQIRNTEETVITMQGLLEIQQPKLQQMADETAQLIERIRVDEADADVTRAAVALEESAANEKAEEAKRIKESCESVLAKVNPILEAAMAQVADIDKRHLRELRTMTHPSDNIKNVMAAVCVCLGVSPVMVTEPGTSGRNAKRRPDYWGPSKKLMTDANDFLNTLLTYKDREGGLDPEIFETGTGKIQHFLADKAFQPEKVRQLSRALAPMCAWVIAMEKYYQVEKRIRPRRAELELAQEDFETAMAHLDVKKEELAKVDARLFEMRTRLQQCTDQKSLLEKQYEDTAMKLDRAKKVIAGLGGEKDRYQKASVAHADSQNHILGDSLVSASYFAYLAPFSQAFRQGLLEKWQGQVGRTLPLSEGFSLQAFLGDEIEVEDWRLDGLPVDTFSIDNAIVAEHTPRTPLFIDPQQQAAGWLKERFAKANIQALTPNQDGYVRSIAMAVQTGVPVLLELQGTELDAVLNPLLMRAIKFDAFGKARLILAEQEVLVHKNWLEETPLRARARLWVVTAHPTPNFKPETSGMVEIINMAITQEGLQNQVLGKIAQNEERTLEAKRVRNLRLGANNKKALKEKETEILELLSQPGSVLDNEDTIDALTTSHKVAEETAVSQREVERILQQCERTKKRFQDVGECIASLFFCVTNLHAVDPMYQFSLDWYMRLFGKCLETSRNDRVNSSALAETDRPKEIQTAFIDAFYKLVTRALFAKDHVVLSFLMALAVTPGIPPEDIRFFCTGGREITDNELQEYDDKKPDWLPKARWRNVVKLATQMEIFAPLVDSFKGIDATDTAAASKVIHQWRVWYDAEAPEDMALPEPWDAAARYDGASPLHKLFVLRALRADRLQTAVKAFVANHSVLGPKYTATPMADLAAVYRETDCTQPVIFILSSGVDPTAELQRLAVDEHMNQKLHTASLGSGMRDRAEKLIADGKNNGWWVVLQNCHLYRDWMPHLARIIDDYSRTSRAQAVHPDFRLWLSTKTTPHFPAAVLQNGCKLIFEAPKGLKPNLLNSYGSTVLRDSDFYDTVSSPVVWKKLCYAMCFFHAVVQERCAFGPIGWNRPYEFTKADLTIALQQLRRAVDSNPTNIPYDALVYLAGECHYGGRVTDARDRRCLMATLCSLFSEKVLDANFSFDPDNVSYVLPDMRVEDAVPFIERLPAETPASLFGLHGTANIARNQRESMQLLDAVLLARPKGTGAGGAALADAAGGDRASGTAEPANPSATLIEACDAYTRALPVPFDLAAVKSLFPTSYKQSMNTVLAMEVERYNDLIKCIKLSLRRVVDALVGTIPITTQIEQTREELLNGRVPSEWRRASYPSLKPLGAYLADLADRCGFFAEWIRREAAPSVFWLSGFFFTQSFLTAVMQNYARGERVPIDSLVWGFEVKQESIHVLSLREPLEDGCFVSGLYLEGARWDPGRRCITDADPGQLYDPYPVVALTLSRRKQRTAADTADGSVSPSRLARPSEDQFGSFTGDTGSVPTPLYKTADRKGELSGDIVDGRINWMTSHTLHSTTGHDSNFVMMFDVPINPHGGAESHPEFWIQRGVALLCQLPH